MYKIYRINDQDYHVYPSGEQKFLAENPNAELIATIGEEQEEAKKMEPAVEEAAPAAGQNVTDLQRDGGLLESPRLNLGRDLEDGLTPEERIQKKREEYTAEDLASIKFQFDKGPEYGKRFGEEAYNKYIETGKIDTNLLPKQNRLVDPITGERLDIADVAINVAKNIPEQMENMWLSTKNMFYNFAEEASRQAALNSGLGSGANVLLSKEQKEAQKEMAINSQKLLDDKIKNNYKTILENYNKMAKNPTGAGILESGSTGLAGTASMVDLVGGVGTAVTSVATSVIPAMAAGAVAGPGASAAVMAQMIIPSMVTDYNIEKANNLYGYLDSEEERVSKLIDENKEELGIPIALGTIATSLEYLGYKGIAKEMAKNMAKNGYKNFAKSLFAISKTKPGTNASTATIRESGTEVAQLIPELTNQAAAKGLSFEDGSAYVLENFIEQAPEVAIQAAFGTRIFQGASANLFKAGKAIRDRFPGVDGVNANSFFTLGVLKQRKDTEKNEDVAKGLENAIAIEEQKIKQAVINGNNITKKLTDDEVNTISTSSQIIDELQEKINDLKDQKELGIINDDQYNTAVAGYKGQVNLENSKINKIVEDAVGRENIRKEDLSFTTQYDAYLEAARIASESRTSNQIAFDNYKNKLKDLELQKAQGKIDNIQFENQKKALVQEYAAIKKENDSKINKLQENLKGVSKSSIEASLKLQEVFDKGIKEGTITKDNNGKNVFSDNVIKQIIETQNPFIKKLSNTIYNAIPIELRIGSKSEFENNIKNTELLDLLRTYDGSSPLGAYLQKFLPLRAQSQRALEGISNQQFKQDLESATVKGMISEEDTDVIPEIKNIETAKALGINESLLSTIKTAAKKALATASKKVDDLKFKSEIAKSFKNDLYKLIKEEKGLKNTKTNPGLTNAITESPEAFYDALAVESMRMARAEDGTNPFKQAGFLKKDKNGDLQKVKFNKDILSKFLNYYTDPSLDKQARSNRQMRLIEALVTSMGAREAINLLENDIEFRKRFAEQQQKEKTKNIFEKAAEKITNVFQQSFEKSKNEFADYDRPWKDIATEYGFEDYNLDDPVQRETWLNQIKASGLINKLPKSFFRNFNGVSDRAIFNGEYVKTLDGKLILEKDYKKLPKEKRPKIERVRSRGVFFINIKEADAWINQAEKEGYTFAEEKDIYSWISKQKTPYTKIVNGKQQIRLQEDFKNKEWVKNEDNKLVGLEEIFTIFENFMFQNGELNLANAAIVAPLLKSTSSWQGHFIRKASPVGFTSIGQMFDKNGKRLFDEEHTLPASAVAKYLFEAAANGAIKNNFKYIKKNYFQGPLLKTNDNKLSGIAINGTRFSYKSKTPEGFRIDKDNIWSRYFNPNVNNNNGGIDPSSILLRNGKTVAEEFNVTSKGTTTPDIKQAQQQVIAEQSKDQIENLIDRAIAKLTELTGTKGTLQTNIGAIPVNIIIGGLRTTKLAYQGGKALADAIAEGYKKVKNYMTEKEWADFVSKSTQEVRNQNNPSQVRLSILSESGVAKMQEQIRKQNEKLLKKLGIEIENLSTDEINDKLNTLYKAKAAASNKKAPKKKARVFDFDDTLAQSKSNVLYTLPDGTSGTLSATEFAAQSEELTEAGAQFDFSEFSQVKEGKKGPLAVLAKKLTEAKGDRDVFVLTARPANSAEAIQSFLRSALGISIPLENITGLGNGAPSAKAFWMAEKVAEGYNDIFFADDAPKNVAAVDKMLTDLGVKKKVQVAKEAEAPSLEDEMDNILRSKKPTKGSLFRKINIYVPPGADDFMGLLYTFLGRGSIGEAQMKFFQDNLMIPFAKGIAAYEAAKVSLARDYKSLKKRYKNKKLLKQKVLDGLYTNEQAIRAYLYEKAGYDLGLNKADAAGLVAVVNGNSELKAFADDLAKITKVTEGYPPITEDWLGGNIQTDLANVSNKAQRKLFLTEFINNKDQIFSDINMKLIKQMHGNDFADALKNVLERMETGVNRKKGKDKEFNAAMNWINQSVANVMAINLRSAVLQQLSIVNFMNWSFNNPFMMAKAMANVPQFGSDFVELWNSTFLTERRGGLKIEINTADLADSEPGNWFLRTHKKLLELGFKPTQWGDSFAISFGGASWYRNKINQLVKQGMNEAEAKEQAMLEFQEVAETSQQSSRPDKISRQQASEIGRFILAFANTPLQYARETKKATLDLINGRGDWKTNASKIIYYGAAQNIIFSSLQSAIFSLLLSDDDDDEKAEKQLGYFANGLLDGFLRGMGYSGAVIAALKNLGMEYYDQYQKRKAGKRVYDPALGLIQAGLTISPPVSKKIGDIVEAQKFENWRQYKNDPFYQGFAIANYTAAIANVPLDRAFKKAENLKAIDMDKNAAWQNILLSLGWSPYQLGIETKKPVATKKKKKKSTTPIFKKEALPQGVLGKAHKDGTIQLAHGLSKEKKKEVLAHEKKHIADMKSGKLNYDAQNVYWNGNAYPRTPDKKIIYDGVAYDEGHKHLPWEKSANNVKV